MKYLDEYRDTEAARKLTAAIARTVTRPWTIMEVCGGQTHTIVRYGIDQVLPPGIELVHGPGCPVCVTPLEMIDRAHAIAARPEVIFCSFGDMLRVPGSRGDLLQLKSQGSDVRVVYSPLDAVNLAAADPDRQVVFFAIGFETTAPANAMAVWLARQRRLTNFSVLVSHVLVPPAIDRHPPGAGQSRAGFPRPGPRLHGDGLQRIRADRRAVIASRSWSRASSRSTCSKACSDVVRQLEAGRAEVENQYGRAVRREGNTASRQLIEDVFEVCDRKWRGIGLIPKSGYRLRSEYRDHDAERRFDVDDIETEESSVCISGEVLQGAEEAARLSGVRHAMHSPDASGRDDGLGRGGLRGLLRL